MNTQDKKHNEIFYPQTIIDDLWSGCQKLELIGCHQEAQSLLEKIVSFSNYQHSEALDRLAKLYEQKYPDKLNFLLEKAASYALLNNQEEKFLDYFTKILRISDFDLTTLEITLNLYAKHHHSFFTSKTNSLKNREKINICVVTTINQTEDSYLYLEKIARNNFQEHSKLSFYFIEDEALSDAEQPLTTSNLTYLESLNSSIYQQEKFQSKVTSLTNAVTFFEVNHFDIVIYFEPLRSSVLNFLLYLQPCNYQVGCFTQTNIFPNALNFALVTTDVTFYDQTPYLKFSYYDPSFDLVNEVVNEFLKTVTPDIEEPNETKQPQTVAPKEQDFDKLPTDTPKKEKATQQKNQNSKSTLARQAINQGSTFTQHNSTHPLDFIKNKGNKFINIKTKPDQNQDFGLSDTTNSNISKEELNDFWNKQSYNNNPEPVKSSNTQNTDDGSKIVDKAILYLQQKDPNKALEVLTKAENSVEPIKDLFYVKALCYISLKDYFNALNAIQSEISLFPNQIKSQSLLQEIEKVIKKKI